MRTLLLIATLGALLLTAVPASATTATFTNDTRIAIPGSGNQGPASPYPSPVIVNGLTGPVTDVAVRFKGVTHDRPVEINALLVSPHGTKVLLMGSNCFEAPLNNYSWTFSQKALNRLGPPCDGTIYRPAPQFTNNPSIPAPAPAGPYATTLDAFNGEQANGTWSLYVADNFTIGSGKMEGWSLTVVTGNVKVEIPATGTNGPAGPYVSTTTISPNQGVVTDVDVRVNDIWHERPGDLDVLLVGPRGQKVVLMSDVCGSREVADATWVFDDEAGGSLPDGTTKACTSGRYSPTNFESSDSWPDPAPPGPYQSALSAFDLTDPAGEWRVFIVDDDSDKVGFVTGSIDVLIAVKPRASVAFAEGAVEVPEGTARTLTLRRTGQGNRGAGRVTVTTTPVTATAGTDFTPISTDVKFAAGETEKTISVDALTDETDEPGENYLVSIGSPSGDAAIDDPSDVVVTIPAPPPPVTGGEGPKTNDPGGPLQPITPADRLAPRVSGFALMPKRFRATRGSRLRFTLSEKANVSIVIERPVRGPRFKRVTTLSRSGLPAGPSSIRLTGRRLAKGVYRATITATDAAGNRSTTRRASFRVSSR